MTKLLLSLVIIGIIFLGLYWLLTNLFSSTGVYTIPISLFLSITLGFYIYTLIDNRMN